MTTDGIRHAQQTPPLDRFGGHGSLRTSVRGERELSGTEPPTASAQGGFAPPARRPRPTKNDAESWPTPAPRVPRGGAPRSTTTRRPAQPMDSPSGPPGRRGRRKRSRQGTRKAGALPKDRAPGKPPCVKGRKGPEPRGRFPRESNRGTDPKTQTRSGRRPIGPPSPGRRTQQAPNHGKFPREPNAVTDQLSPETEAQRPIEPKPWRQAPSGARPRAEAQAPCRETRSQEH